MLWVFLHANTSMFLLSDSVPGSGKCRAFKPLVKHKLVLKVKLFVASFLLPIIMHDYEVIFFAAQFKSSKAKLFNCTERLRTEMTTG